MIPTVTVDARAVTARFSPAGIPESVRKNLRAVLPDLTKRLGARVEAKLDTELKSRTNLKVEKLMREDPTKVVGQVRTVWTGDSAKSFIPQILETGAKAHPIFPVNASALSFFWARIGQHMILKSVFHPGFPGINYMQRSFQEMETEIFDSMTRAVRAGARGEAA